MKQKIGVAVAAVVYRAPPRNLCSACAPPFLQKKNTVTQREVGGADGADAAGRQRNRQAARGLGGICVHVHAHTHTRAHFGHEPATRRQRPIHLKTEKVEEEEDRVEYKLMRCPLHARKTAAARLLPRIPPRSCARCFWVRVRATQRESTTAATTTSPGDLLRCWPTGRRQCDGGGQQLGRGGQMHKRARRVRQGGHGA